MSQGPYSSYRGRRGHGRSVLIGVAAALVILLAAVLAGYYLGLFNIPGLPANDAGATPMPSDEAVPSQEPALIIETPAPSPSPSPAAADLSAYQVRDIPLGLVEVAGAGPRAGQGGIFDMTGGLTTPGQLPQGDRQASREVCAQLPYAVAWLSPDWEELLARDGGGEDLTEWCLALADSGYDEILFSEAVPADDGAGLARLYTGLKAALAEAKWQGRLGLVLDQALLGEGYDSALAPAIAQSFDRLYFRETLTPANKDLLTGNGFEANGYTLVTAVSAPADLPYAWAVLPR